jgi:hypothetical protein
MSRDEKIGYYFAALVIAVMIVAAIAGGLGNR